MGFYIALDSGGSKTKLRLYSFGGELIKESSAQGFGLAEDSETVLSDATEVLLEFCAGYKICSVICNLGGKNKTQMKGIKSTR